MTKGTQPINAQAQIPVVADPEETVTKQRQTQACRSCGMLHGRFARASPSLGAPGQSFAQWALEAGHHPHPVVNIENLGSSRRVNRRNSHVSGTRWSVGLSMGGDDSVL